MNRDNNRERIKKEIITELEKLKSNYLIKFWSAKYSEVVFEQMVYGVWWISYRK